MTIFAHGATYVFEQFVQHPTQDQTKFWNLIQALKWTTEMHNFELSEPVSRITNHGFPAICLICIM